MKNKRKLYKKILEEAERLESLIKTLSFFKKRYLNPNEIEFLKDFQNLVENLIDLEYERLSDEEGETISEQLKRLKESLEENNIVDEEAEKLHKELLELHRERRYYDRGQVIEKYAQRWAEMYERQEITKEEFKDLLLYLKLLGVRLNKYNDIIES